MPDQEVHEIQLNGKQLVFMFMAATVVSVVIFLCGVMVGRGVRQPVADTLATSAGASIDPSAPDVSGDKPPVAVESAPERENLTYAERLEAPTLSEPLKLTETKPAVAPAPAAVEKAAVEKAAVEKAAVEKAAVEKAVPPVTPKEPKAPKDQPTRKTATSPSASAAKPDAVAASLAEPPGKGFVIQVQALPTQTAANALAGRLKSKGYSAFVTTNPANVSLKYRVRVKYPDKREADAGLLRLKQEEHVDPWPIR